MNSPLFTKLCVLFVTAMLISNIIAVKLISLGPLIVPAAVFVFPITYILSDIFSEVYGYRASRITAWYAFGANLLMVLFFKLVIALPGAPFWGPENQKALEMTLDGTWRILIASLTAYMIGDFVNDVVFQKMKEKQGEKGFGVRAIVSSVIGEGLDSFLFITIAFWGTDFFSWIAILSQWGIKLIYEAIFLPITIFATKKIKLAEHGYVSAYGNSYKN
ncbi:MAG: queuosine precursor transporter [Fibromonadales bacterium]|nr:queuosine precursor transporter [Fibromonadales bacterium]